MLKVIITFDYEIFFGKNNASENEILFSPTDELLTLLNKYNLKGTFFADVLSVEAYKRENLQNNYPVLFENQLRDMAKAGHDVQLHIHPHWITAKYDKSIKQWIIDPKTYRIHYFFNNNDLNINAEQIIQNGISYLNETIKPVNEQYKVYAYRAGGYCIQPEDELFKLLSKNGIQLDSSVCVGKKLHSEAHFFDFDKEYDELNWKLASDIVELPIGSVNNNLVKRFIPGTGFQTLKKKPAKGEGIAGTTKATQSKFKRLLHFNKTKREFGLEFMHYKQLMYGLKQYYKKYDCKNQDKYVAVICHPKSMDSISIKNMEIFINKVLENKKWVCFSTLKEMRNCINNQEASSV